MSPDDYSGQQEFTDLLKDAGFASKGISHILPVFQTNGIEKLSDLYPYSADALSKLEGMKISYARRIISEVRMIQRGGSTLMSVKDLRELEASYQYLSTPCQALEKMLTYSNTHTGIRSSTLVEIYGEASVGKTQLCMTMAAMCMRPKEVGGWGKGVIYIDTEGAFEYSRFIYIAKYWGVPVKFVEDNLIVAKVKSFDEVDEAIDLCSAEFKKRESVAVNDEDYAEFGLIIIDSIMDPLKSSYPLNNDDLSNLQPRQAHLKRVTDQLKSLANQHNAIALYTNHVRVNLDDQDTALVPQGGNVMAHASDIRIEMRHVPISKMGYSDEEVAAIEPYGITVAEATVVDCGFLPKGSGKYLIAPMGIADCDLLHEVLEQSRVSKEKGYLCVNAEGDEIPPLIQEHAVITSESGNKKNYSALYQV